MGRVLLARDPVLDRNVAIKLLRDDLKLPPEQLPSLLERMRQEARASARVVHPNIVALHDMGEDPEFGLFLVFEYVEGPTLKERLQTRGSLGPEAAGKLARELGDALTTAHAAGVLHRDIKPENLILNRAGAKIADFGIARVPDSTLTRDGGLLGTPAYSAPEAISSGTFSPQSDQFSLAATLYEALSGKRAFPGQDAIAVATRIATEHPPTIAGACGLDPHVDAALFRALDKDPRKRWPSCDDFGRALAEALALSPRSRMPTLPDRQRRELEHGTERRGRVLAVGGFLAGAVVIGLAAFASGALDRGPATAPAPSGEEPNEPLGFLAERPPSAAPKRDPGREADSPSAAARPAADGGAEEDAKAAEPADGASTTEPRPGEAPDAAGGI